MADVSLAVAFGAGVVSFFAPCVIPLLPAYVGYITGVSLQDLKDKGYAPYRKKMLITSILYILGFSLVFALLGSAVAGAGSLLRGNGRIIQLAGGLVMIVLGLEFAGFFHINALGTQRKVTLPNWVDKLGYGKAFFLGLVFAVTWTPCVGAVLGSILTLAAVTGTAASGAFLLFVYSLGISLPFLLVAITLASAPKYLKFIQTKVEIIAKISGLILALLGVLLVTGTYGYLNTFLFDLAFKLGYEIR